VVSSTLNKALLIDEDGVTEKAFLDCSRMHYLFKSKFTNFDFHSLVSFHFDSAWTTRLISAKDHGSVQINVANVDPVTGLYTGDYKAFALAGYIRAKSEGDEALATLVQKSDAGMNAE